MALLQKEETVTYEDFEALAAKARPVSGPVADDEAEFERQLAAMNAFHKACEEFDPEFFGEDSDYSRWCLHATDDEMIDVAMRTLGERFGVAAPSP